MRITSGFFLIAALTCANPAVAQTARPDPATQMTAVPPKPAGLRDLSKGMPGPGPKPITSDPSWTPATAQEHGHVAFPLKSFALLKPPSVPALKPAATP